MTDTETLPSGRKGLLRTRFATPEALPVDRWASSLNAFALPWSILFPSLWIDQDQVEAPRFGTQIASFGGAPSAFRPGGSKAATQAAM